jgi:opacity protein-like surface antigen
MFVLYFRCRRAGCLPCSEANLPLPAMAPPPPPPYDMTGFYVGGHVGAGWASDANITGLLGGVHGGYNFQIPTQWDLLGWYVNGYVLGVEADGTWRSTLVPKRVPTRFCRVPY